MNKLLGEPRKRKPEADVQFFSLPQMLDMAETTFSTLLRVHGENATAFERERDLLFTKEIVALCKEKYELPQSCAGILLCNIGLQMLQGINPFEHVSE